MIRNLKDYLPILTGILILNSAVHLIKYYNMFGISIIDYMDFTELVLGFFDDFLIIVYSLLSILIWVLLEDFIFNTNGNLTHVKNSKAKRMQFYRISILAFLGIHLLSQLALIWLKEYYVYLSTIVIFFLVIFWIFKKGASIDKYSKYVITVLSLIYLLYLLAGFNAAEIIERKDKTEVTVILENKTIRTNENLRYIGKSRNYIFFYNLIEQASIVIPTKRILETKIENK